MIKIQIIIPLLLIALIAMPRHIRNISCKRHHSSAEKSMQDSSSLLQNDLNRTTIAHNHHQSPPLTPISSQPAPATARQHQPREMLAAQSSAASKRVVQAPAPIIQQEERNKTGGGQTRVPSPSSTIVINHHQAPAASLNGAPIASLTSVRSKWRQMEQTIGKSMASASLELKRTLDEIYSTLDQQDKRISQACKQSLGELIESLRDQQLWAGQMMDSSAAIRGQLPSGLLEGTLTDLGHFDECLAIGQRSTDPTSGQYCSVLIKPALVGRPRLHTVCRRMPSLSPMLSSSIGGGLGIGNSTIKLLSQQSHQFYYAGLRLGVCVPSGCGQPDVERILQAYLIRFELIGQVKHCQRASAEDLSGRPETGFKQNITIGTTTTTRTIGIKSSSLGQSISQNFDLLQQYILLAYFILFVLILLGTWLDDSHSRPHSVTKGTGDYNIATTSYVTGGLASQIVHANWQPQYPDRSHNKSASGEQTIPNGLKQVKPGQDDSQLGPQKNPLASFSAPSSLSSSSSSSSSSSPVSSDNGGPILASDSLIPMLAGHGNRVHFEDVQGPACQTRGPKRNQKSAKSNNIVAANEMSPIYDEIHLPGVQVASNEPSLIRELLVCFSLKGSLRSIGKLTPSPKAGLRPSDFGSNYDDAGGGSAARGGAPSASMSDIKVIHGLRTLSMIWIIFGHTIGLVTPEMMNNLFALANLSCSSRFLQAILNTTLAVDTFFMISGLVTVVSFARKCNSAMRLLIRPSELLPEIGRLERCNNTLSHTKRDQQCLSNDYQLGHQGEMDNMNEGRHDEQQMTTDASYSLDPNQSRRPQLKAVVPMELNHQLTLDGLEMEVTSVDSSTSVITSLSSSASSNRCIGLASSKSSSQKNFIINKNLGPTGANRVVPINNQAAFASGWPADFKPFSWLIMRYLRLTPSYAAIIGLSILMPALGSGPFWPETVGQLGPACRENWWTNLLYVNNFIETNNLCLIHSWYLSNDWQFFLVALVLFGLAYKSRKLALLVLVSLFVGCSVNTFIVTIENDYPPTIVTTSPAIAERWEFIYSLYYKPWPHLPSYLVGLIVGCMIIRLKQFEATRQGLKPPILRSSSLELSAGARYIFWILSIAISFAVLNSIYPWNMGIQVDPIITGLHSATFRTLWATSCAWLVFALVSKPRNPLALLLSWHGFQITSRLTYCAYLVHPLIILYHFGVLRERMDSSIYGQLHRFMGTLLTSYLLAFVLSICFESPFIRLQALLARLLNGQSNSGRHRPHKQTTKHGNKPNQKPRPLLSRASVASGAANARSTKALAMNRDQTVPNATRGRLDGSNIATSSSSSLLKGSFDLENSMPPLKLTRNQVTGQFIVRPIDFASDDSHRLIDSYSFASHRLDSRADKQTRHYSPCGLHDHPSSSSNGPCNQRNNNSSNHGAVDEEFQRKLAQAIGRGFKIRSKIVNGTGKQSVAGVQSRRTGQDACIPELGEGCSVGLAPMFSFDAPAQRRARPPTQQRPNKAGARRAEPFSTFVPLPSNGGTKPGT